MASQLANLYLTGYSGLVYSDISGLTGKTLSAAEQAVVTNLIKEVESYLCSKTKRQFRVIDSGSTKQIYHEVFDAGGYKYALHNFPIYRVQKIEVDGVTKYEAGGSNNELTLGVDFFVYDDYIRFASSPVSSVDNRRALKISYELEQFWGDDVKLAIKRAVSEMYLSKEYGTKGVKSIGLTGDFSISFDDQIANYLKEVIANYRKIRV